jgi:hypothetical protein
MPPESNSEALDTAFVFKSGEILISGAISKSN